MLLSISIYSSKLFTIPYSYEKLVVRVSVMQNLEKNSSYLINI